MSQTKAEVFFSPAHLVISPKILVWTNLMTLQSGPSPIDFKIVMYLCQKYLARLLQNAWAKL